MRSQRFVAIAIALIMIVILAVAALAAPAPARRADLRLKSEPLPADDAPAAPQGRPLAPPSQQRVFLQLQGASLADAWLHSRSLPAQQRLAVVTDREAALAAEQARAAALVQGLGGRVLAAYGGAVFSEIPLLQSTLCNDVVQNVLLHQGIVKTLKSAGVRFLVRAESECIGLLRPDNRSIPHPPLIGR